MGDQAIAAVADSSSKIVAEFTKQLADDNKYIQMGMEESNRKADIEQLGKPGTTPEQKAVLMASLGVDPSKFVNLAPAQEASPQGLGEMARVIDVKPVSMGVSSGMLLS